MMLVEYCYQLAKVYCNILQDHETLKNSTVIREHFEKVNLKAHTFGFRMVFIPSSDASRIKSYGPILLEYKKCGKISRGSINTWDG